MESICETSTVEQLPLTPQKQQTKLPAFKVTKPGVKRIARKTPKKLQRPVVPSGMIFPIKVQADGLLNVKDTPAYLIDAVKRNSTASRLLSLNKIIRLKIWEYAMGGHTIEIRSRKAQVAEDGTATSSFPSIGSQYTSKVAHYGPKRTQPKTAFHLPEVCRQIYTESATIGYSTNQFAFIGEVEVKYGREDGPDGALEGWCRELLPAQVNAVTCIRPHWHDLQDYLSTENMRAFKQLFPHLKQIRVPSRAVNCDAKWPNRGDPMRKHLRQQAKDRIAAIIKFQEGDDVEAIFSVIED